MPRALDVFAPDAFELDPAGVWERGGANVRGPRRPRQKLADDRAAAPSSGGAIPSSGYELHLENCR
jgi:hypothetical protein